MKRIIATVCALILLLAGCGDAAKYKRGTLTDTGFESAFLGLAFTLPEGYEMASEEDMADFEEMMATASGGLPNVSVTVERLPHARLTVEQYISSFKEQMADSTFLSVSFVGEVEIVELAGQRWHKLSSVSTTYGMELFQDYLLRKVGDRIVSVVVTWSEGTADEMHELLEGFGPL